MTANIQNANVQTLYKLAADDLRVLDFDLPDAIFGFHCQQSCEKSLKALASAHGKKYPFTHEMKTLVALVEDCGETLPALPIRLSDLDEFAIEFR